MAVDYEDAERLRAGQRLALGGNATALAGLEDLLDDISRLRPHPENPRNGDVDAIMASIRVNGVYRPLYAQASTGYILAGNHTYAALMEMGATRAPIVWLDVDGAAARRILAVDNRASDLGRYDDAMLIDLLATIEESEGGLLGSGYTDEDMLAMMQLVEERAVTPISPEEFPAFAPSDLAVDYHCPSCGYEWSGPPTGISGRGREKRRA